jgi:pteridine reductase
MLHVEAPVQLTDALQEALKRGEGSIVSMVDTSWGKAWPHLGDYSASKAALRQRTLGWALDLAPHVRANAVAPGAILAADWEQDAFADTVARLPLQRSGQPEDVAAAVRYFLEAPYVTGQVLAVDGGWGLI